MYRLPNGKQTKDPDEYGKAWFDLANKVCKFFPGYVVNGVDPHIILSRRKIHADNTYTHLDSITLPVYAAMNICAPVTGCQYTWGDYHECSCISNHKDDEETSTYITKKHYCHCGSFCSAGSPKG